MAFNTLSGTINAIDLIATGTFSGSYVGDGSGLENVEQFTLYNNEDTLIPFYKVVTGEFHLDSTASFSFSKVNNSLGTPRITASVGIKLSNPTSGSLAGPGSYLGLDSGGNIIVTSSAGGGGGGGSTATGPTNSIQYHSGSSVLTGSKGLIYDGLVLNISGSGSSGEALSVTGSLLPGDTNMYDLGSPTRQWKSLYVSSSTIYFGGEPLSVENGDLKFGHESATKSFRVGNLRLRDKSIIAPSGTVFHVVSQQMQFFGGISYKRKVVSWDYEVLKTNFLIAVQSNTLTASVTLFLPTASTCLNGQTFLFKDEGGNSHTHNIIISASSTNTIDGQSSITIESPYAAVNLYTNGADKFFVY